MSGGREGAAHATAAPGTRLMLFRTRGCTVALALDAVESVFTLVAEPGARQASLPEGGAVPLIDWSSLSGVPVAEGDPEPTEVVVLSTGSGSVGLPVERCLGTRRVSLAASQLAPTRLVDDVGSPACLLLRIDARPVFLLEPRALAGAAHLDLSEAEPPPVEIADAHGAPVLGS